MVFLYKYLLNFRSCIAVLPLLHFPQQYLNSPDGHKNLIHDYKICINNGRIFRTPLIAACYIIKHACRRGRAMALKSKR